MTHINVYHRRFNQRIHLSGGTIVAQGLALFLVLSHGITKQLAHIDWLDIVAEGSVFIFAATWIIAVIVSRPAGKVTTLMVAGLNCLAFTALLDLLDELFYYPLASQWLGMIESVPAAAGMVIMTVALVFWHREQLALNVQLQRRESYYRDHENIDTVTQLYPAAYFCDRAADYQRRLVHASILMVDINQFSRFNSRFGHLEGNRLLQEVGRLLVMHVRHEDLVCRYASDRFVILLPDMELHAANELASQIQNSVNHLAFRIATNTTAVFQSVRTAVIECGPEHDVDELLARLNLKLTHCEISVA